MRGKDGPLMDTFYGRKKFRYFELYFLLTDSDRRGDALPTVFPGTVLVQASLGVGLSPIWRRLTQLVQLVLISVEKKIMILADLIFSIFARGKTLPLDEDFA